MPPVGSAPGLVQPRRLQSVDRVLQALARLELGLGRRLDRHRLAGARVAAGRRLALRHREGAEADETDLVALLERGGDRIEHRFDCLGGIALAQPRRIGDVADQFLLVHALGTPCLTLERRKGITTEVGRLVSRLNPSESKQNAGFSGIRVPNRGKLTPIHAKTRLAPSTLSLWAAIGDNAPCSIAPASPSA